MPSILLRDEHCQGPVWSSLRPFHHLLFLCMSEAGKGQCSLSSLHVVYACIILSHSEDLEISQLNTCVSQTPHTLQQNANVIIYSSSLQRPCAESAQSSVLECGLKPLASIYHESINAPVTDKTMIAFTFPFSMLFALSALTLCTRICILLSLVLGISAILLVVGG